jgi:hypothetical protein
MIRHHDNRLGAQGVFGHHIAISHPQRVDVLKKKMRARFTVKKNVPPGQYMRW